jgi:hypothetical protein
MRGLLFTGASLDRCLSGYQALFIISNGTCHTLQALREMGNEHALNMLEGLRDGKIIAS